MVSESICLSLVCDFDNIAKTDANVLDQSASILEIVELHLSVRVELAIRYANNYLLELLALTYL